MQRIADPKALTRFLQYFSQPRGTGHDSLPLYMDDSDRLWVSVSLVNVSARVDKGFHTRRCADAEFVGLPGSIIQSNVCAFTWPCALATEGRRSPTEMRPLPTSAGPWKWRADTRRKETSVAPTATHKRGPATASSTFPLKTSSLRRREVIWEVYSSSMVGRRASKRAPRRRKQRKCTPRRAQCKPASLPRSSRWASVIHPHCESLHRTRGCRSHRADGFLSLRSLSASFLVAPEPKRNGRFRRSTRKELLHAISSLLTRQSEYLRNLLSGEFQEGIEPQRQKKKAAEPRTPAADVDDDDEEEEDRPLVTSLEEWQAYFSDSDASYYDDDEDDDDDDDSDTEAMAAPPVSSTSCISSDERQSN